MDTPFDTQFLRYLNPGPNQSGPKKLRSERKCSLEKAFVGHRSTMVATLQNRSVPFARQRSPIVGVLRMCWLLPGSFDCFCCPYASVHRPSVACLTVFLCA